MSDLSADFIVSPPCRLACIEEKLILLVGFFLIIRSSRQLLVIYGPMIWIGLIGFSVLDPVDVPHWTQRYS